MQAFIFDLGGTFLRAGITRSDGSVAHVQKARIPSIVTGCPADRVWHELCGRIIAYESQHRQLVPASAPIVISFPGPVSGHRYPHQAATLSGSATILFDIAGFLEHRTGRGVQLLNDVSSAAWRIAEITSASRFLVVTVSSGIGSKMFDSSHPGGVIDESPFSGEIGHVVVDASPSAPICDCGARGHLSAIASGRGIERYARLEAAHNPRAFQESKVAREFGATLRTLNNEEHLVPAILVGDSWSIRAVAAPTRSLAQVLLMIAVAAALDSVFVIGGFAQALGLTYLKLLRTLAVESSRFSLIEDRIDRLFQFPNYSSDICLEGCAAFLRKGEIRI